MSAGWSNLRTCFSSSEQQSRRAFGCIAPYCPTVQPCFVAEQPRLGSAGNRAAAKALPHIAELALTRQARSLHKLPNDMATGALAPGLDFRPLPGLQTVGTEFIVHSKRRTKPRHGNAFLLVNGQARPFANAGRPRAAWRMTGLLPMRKPGFELLRLTLRASAQQAMICHRFQATPVANAQNRC